MKPVAKRATPAAIAVLRSAQQQALASHVADLRRIQQTAVTQFVRHVAAQQARVAVLAVP